MDMNGISTTAQDLFRIDELLDFSNEEILASSSSANNNTTTVNTDVNQIPPPQNPSIDYHSSLSTDFTNDLCIPSDDVAELEWLSQFVDDSFTDCSKSSIADTLTVRPDASGRGRSKRSKATNSAMNPTTWNWTSLETGDSKAKRETNRQPSPTPDGGVRKCTHCASEKTPQWRTGPLGPKTLCNACGVRYKSGRLVPEYRPAASPTFVLTQHSNSHRKVLELRRQKELLRQSSSGSNNNSSSKARDQSIVPSVALKFANVANLNVS